MHCFTLDIVKNGERTYMRDCMSMEMKKKMFTGLKTDEWFCIIRKDSSICYETCRDDKCNSTKDIYKSVAIFSASVLATVVYMML